MSEPRLPRLLPDPVPAIHPLPEYLAEGERKAVYEETKAALQVPWMGVVAMAFAHYPRFYAALWEGVRPLCRSAAFLEACTRLRKRAESAADELQPPPLRARLEQQGYAAREVEQIRAVIEVFSHGNMPYLLIATLARLLLEGHSLSEDRDAPPAGGHHAPHGDGPLVLMEPHHANSATRALYDDVKDTLGLPFVNTDYRALARWPSYFAAAWGDLRDHVATPRYAKLTGEVHSTAVALASDLPNPADSTPERLLDAAEADGSAEEVLAVVRLFQWLLPGLALNVAFFRAQLES